MKAEILRKLSAELEAQMNQPATLAPQGMIVLCQGLLEVAAQLAELNESRKPRWVMVKASGKNVAVNADQVRCLFEYGEKTLLDWNGINGDETVTVEAPFSEVCAKLGISVEGYIKCP